MRALPQVRFTCAPEVRDNLLLSVRAFPTCNYVVMVGTQLLCHTRFEVCCCPAVQRCATWHAMTAGTGDAYDPLLSQDATY